MRTSAIIAICVLLLAISCQSDKGRERLGRFDTRKYRDFPEIRQAGELRALIAYSGTSYFLYRGRPMGYEFELLQQLADHFGLELELTISKDLNKMLDEVKAGNVDLVAHGLAITKERQKKAAFTDYLYLTQQVLVQRKPPNWRSLNRMEQRKLMINDPVQLIGDTVSVRKNSSYYMRLLHLSDELGEDIHIEVLDGNLSTDEIIKMVADGEIKYTIADSNLAHINASSYPNLDVEVPMSSSQRIAWALQPKSRILLDSINAWILNHRKKKEFNIIFNKYFKNQRSFNRRIRSDFYSLNKKQISPFDDLIKESASKINWDWRLLASLIYQESRFETDAQSWAGAQGLMQMMPGTAEELGVNNVLDPRDNISGGSLYLKRLYNRFPEITDSVQRIKFSMAAYNCGFSHVKDAQRLANHKDLDPTLWDGHVAEMILALSNPRNFNLEFIQNGYVNGKEPYRYVNQIFERYEHYKRFIDN